MPWPGKCVDNGITARIHWVKNDSCAKDKMRDTLKPMLLEPKLLFAHCFVPRRLDVLRAAINGHWEQ